MCCTQACICVSVWEEAREKNAVLLAKALKYRQREKELGENTAYSYKNNSCLTLVYGISYSIYCPSFEYSFKCHIGSFMQHKHTNTRIYVFPASFELPL